MYADEAIRQCYVHMNDLSSVELGTLYTETPEVIAIEKAMPEAELT
jgi:hypothetical protein